MRDNDDGGDGGDDGGGDDDGGGETFTSDYEEKIGSKIGQVLIVNQCNVWQIFRFSAHK